MITEYLPSGYCRKDEFDRQTKPGESNEWNREPDGREHLHKLIVKGSYRAIKLGQMKRRFVLRFDLTSRNQSQLLAIAIPGPVESWFVSY
jgi:hypothetical protein